MAAYRRVYDSVTCRLTAKRTWISSETLRSATEYGLALPFLPMAVAVVAEQPATRPAPDRRGVRYI